MLTASSQAPAVPAAPHTSIAAWASPAAALVAAGKVISARRGVVKRRATDWRFSVPLADHTYISFASCRPPVQDKADQKSGRQICIGHEAGSREYVSCCHSAFCIAAGVDLPAKVREARLEIELPSLR